MPTAVYILIYNKLVLWGYVYVFEFPNGKRYVGATTMENPKDRWKHGKGYEGIVREAIDHFGWRHVIKLACWVPDSELDEQERYYIEKYKTIDPEFGYNRHTGGRTGFKINQDAIKNQSKCRIGKSHPHKRPSREVCSKISESLTGKHQSYETRKKRSESLKLYWANIKQASQN